MRKTEYFKFGNPYNTGACIKQIDESEKNRLGEYFCEINKTETETEFVYKLGICESVFGLGEQMGSVSRRGRRYRTYNSDDPHHTPDKDTLYGAHPFIILKGEKNLGLFIDYGGEIEFDIGYSHKDYMKIIVRNSDFNFYLFQSEKSSEIIKEYLELTGPAFLPPKWSFGFQQCRWSYPDGKSIEEIAENFRKYEIPCDAIYMDIDYMEDYKVFTVDDQKFPEFKKFSEKIHNAGFHLIPIIDPGVKIEKDYSVYEEGKEKKYFCTDEFGEEFIAAVWPGETHLPDFNNPEASIWWGNLYHELMELGIKGFWNDMNEPAIFYTPRGIKKINDFMLENKNKEIKTPDEIRDIVNSISNAREDYREIYQYKNESEKICHEEIHNLYGFQMAESTGVGIKSKFPGKRYFLLSRSSYAGQQRFSGIWTGDNCSWWEHIKLNLRMLISLNLCGFNYSGADIGGFGSNSNSELLIRWTQVGIFSPLFRNHSALNTRDQEPWKFDDETLQIVKETIKLRYSLMPYLYSEYLKSVKELKPFISPLWLDNNSKRNLEIEDQFLWGDSIMAAPVYEQNARGRFVHLPEDKYLLWKTSNWETREMKIMESGDYYIDAELNENIFFIRENKLICLHEPLQYVNEKPVEELIVTGLVSSRAKFCFYDDDGETIDEIFQNTVEISGEIKIDNEEMKIEYIIKDSSNYKKLYKQIRFEIYDEEGNYFEKIEVIE